MKLLKSGNIHHQISSNKTSVPFLSYTLPILASQFPDKKKVVSLIRQLSWTHISALIPIEDSLKQNFYIQMCIHEKWSVRTFRERINSMLYERTAISNQGFIRCLCLRLFAFD